VIVSEKRGAQERSEKEKREIENQVGKETKRAARIGKSEKEEGKRRQSES